VKAESYILVIDEGTTGTRALVINRHSAVVAQAYSEFTQYHPAHNRVEHDAEEIWEMSLRMVREALANGSISIDQIAAIGITNQRATTVVWDRSTGKPISPAIVWQDTRTGNFADELRNEWGDKVLERTGWSVNPVYSSLSLAWILENVSGASEKAARGELAFGTIDSWLIYKLTGCRRHVIAASNASVTGAYDLVNKEWYADWLHFLQLPLSLFPTVLDDSGDFGLTDPAILGAAIPITGAIADQHAALFAQGCIEKGMVKCTHGTGTFLDMNVGENVVISKRGLNAIIAWRRNGVTTYGLEGYSAVTGAAIQWLRDGAELISDAAQSEQLAMSVPDSGGLLFVPALAGLAAPYWDPYARGLIIGITLGTKRAHIVRAALEGIGFSVKDFLQTMCDESGIQVTSIKVDGGASRNNFLLQFQADILNVEVVRPANAEATSLGAAYMAGLAVGYWKNEEDCFFERGEERRFRPAIDPASREKRYRQWSAAVQRALGWANV